MKWTSEILKDKAPHPTSDGRSRKNEEAALASRSNADCRCGDATSVEIDHNKLHLRTWNRCQCQSDVSCGVYIVRASLMRAVHHAPGARLRRTPPSGVVRKPIERRLRSNAADATSRGAVSFVRVAGRAERARIMRLQQATAPEPGLAGRPVPTVLRERRDPSHRETGSG